MKNKKHYIIQSITIGFVTLSIFSLSLFWLRYSLWKGSRVALMRTNQNLQLSFQNTGLFGDETNNPEIIRHSSLSAQFFPHDEEVLAIHQRKKLIRHYEAYFNVTSSDLYQPVTSNIYFDKNLSVVVVKLYQADTLMGRRSWKFQKQIFAGPNGISENIAEVGKFETDPVFYQSITTVVLFDFKSRQFYQINFRDNTVRHGPMLPSDIIPVKREYGSNTDISFNLIHTFLEAPYIKSTGDSSDSDRSISIQIDGQDISADPLVENLDLYDFQNKLVLDTNGNIHYLNIETLTLTGPIASWDILQSYNSAPSLEYLLPPDEKIFTWRADPVSLDRKIIGAIITVVTADLNKMAVKIFDANGHTINHKERFLKPSSVPGGPLTITLQYTAEAFAPFALHLLSPITDHYLSARSSYRQIFTMPNSIAASIAARETQSLFTAFFLNAILAFPSLLIAAFFIGRLKTQARKLGMSKKSKVFWSITTLLFGLPAYITFLLTRPAETLVTCQNCGSLRRPDHLHCHNCQRTWNMDDLQPPTWRVFETQQQHKKEAIPPSQ